jgi:hypothetical protein
MRIELNYYYLQDDLQRDSSVILVTRLEAGRLRVSIPAEVRDFSFFRNVQPVPCGPLSLISSGYRGNSRGVKRPGYEVDHLAPSSTVIQN